MKIPVFKSIFVLAVGAQFLGCASPVETKVLGSDGFQVHFSKYLAGGESSQKSLIIVPPTGGTNLIDRSYARKFAARGYDVYILDSWTSQNEVATDFELHQRFYSRAQRAITLVLHEVKSPFVGLLGTSVGALHGSIAAASSLRFNAVFSIVGGAPIAEVIVGSDQQAMMDLKEARKTRYGLKSDEEMILGIGKAFQLEPMDMGELHKGKDLGMVIADEDTTVMSEAQNKLAKFWQPSVTIRLNNTHFWAIVKTWIFYSEELVDFFDSSFKKQRPVH